METITDIKYYAIFFFIWLISSLLLRDLSKKQAKSTIHLPPSPPALPFIGHLHLLRPVVTKCFPYLSSKYGPLLYLRLGSRRLLLVSSASFAEEIFKNNDIAFAERPKSPFDDKLLFGNFSFLGSPYGDYWKFMKKLCNTELFGIRQVERSQAVRQEEHRRFLNKMLEKANQHESVNLCNELMKLTNNIICRMVMSRRCSEQEDEAEKCRKLVLGSIELVGKVGIATMLGPFKKLGFWINRKQLSDVPTKFDELLDRILKEHEQRSNKKNGDEDDEEEDKDFMDILLQVHHDKDSEFTITKNHIKSFIMDLFLGGTNTSAVTMQWMMAELINHPNVFRKLRDEIESVVGKNRLVEESDISKLHYLQAAVKETLRLYPAIPAMPRECREDCRIGEFDIPKQTVAIIDAYSIMRDPKLWDNPNHFYPERFLQNHDDKIQKETNNKQKFSFIPFGGGRRICPASHLAFSIVHITIASIVQCFDWKLVGDEGDKPRVNMEARAGMVMGLANPLLCLPVVHFHPR